MENVEGYTESVSGDASVVGSRPAVVLSPETENYLQRLETEIKYLGESYPSLRAAAEREVALIRNGEISPNGYVIVHKEQPIKFVRKIYIPIKEHPEVNFVGRLLGVKGATLKALQQQTRARILIFGRGSMRDQAKEEEMRNGGDPRYTHLKEDLHVYVEIHAYPVEAEGRFANALAELKRFLDPNVPNPMPGALGVRPGMPMMRPPYRPPFRPRGPVPSRYPPPQQSYQHHDQQAYAASAYPTSTPASTYQSTPPATFSAAPAYASWPEAAPGTTNGQPVESQPAYSAPQAWGQPPAKMPRLATPYSQPSSY